MSAADIGYTQVGKRRNNFDEKFLHCLAFDVRAVGGPCSGPEPGPPQNLAAGECFAGINIAVGGRGALTLTPPHYCGLESDSLHYSGIFFYISLLNKSTNRENV